MPRHWLMKTEPDAYSIDDLERDGSTGWDGVRNYQARNFMRDEMRRGDWVLLYHSNADPPGVAGIAKVCSREAIPDPTQFDRNDSHFDPKSSKDDPRWLMVEIEFAERFADVVPLGDLRDRDDLAGMPLLQRGQRLSVQPVDPEHFRIVRRLGRATAKSKAKR